MIYDENFFKKKKSDIYDIWQRYSDVQIKSIKECRKRSLDLIINLITWSGAIVAIMVGLLATTDSSSVIYWQHRVSFWMFIFTIFFGLFFYKFILEITEKSAKNDLRQKEIFFTELQKKCIAGQNIAPNFNAENLDLEINKDLMSLLERKDPGLYEGFLVGIEYGICIDFFLAVLFLAIPFF